METLLPAVYGSSCHHQQPRPLPGAEVWKIGATKEHQYCYLAGFAVFQKIMTFIAFFLIVWAQRGRKGCPDLPQKNKFAAPDTYDHSEAFCKPRPIFSTKVV